MSSTNCTLGSMTQMSAPSMSRIWLVVLRIRPQKDRRSAGRSSSDAKATPKMMPRYLVRSPVSIFRAIQFMRVTSL